MKATLLLLALIYSPRVAAEPFLLATAQLLVPAATFSFLRGGSASVQLADVRSQDNVEYLRLHYPDQLPALAPNITYQHTIHLLVCREHNLYNYLVMRHVVQRDRQSQSVSEDKAETLYNADNDKSLLRYSFLSTPFEESLRANDLLNMALDSDEIYADLEPDLLCGDVVNNTSNGLWSVCQKIELIYAKNMTASLRATQTFQQPITVHRRDIRSNYRTVTEEINRAAALESDDTFDNISSPDTGLISDAIVRPEDHKVIEGPVVVYQPNTDLTIEDPGVYVVALLKCGGISNWGTFRVTGNFSSNFINPLGFQFAPYPLGPTTHLPAGIIGVLSLHPISIIIWAICLGLWLYNWFMYYNVNNHGQITTRSLFNCFRNRSHNNLSSQSHSTRPMLHTIMLAVPTIRLLYHIFSIVYFTWASIIGNLSAAAEIARAFILAFSLLAIYAVLMLMSKGWCITRRSFASVEIRSMMGTTMFIIISEIFYALVWGSALLAIFLFYSVYFAYLRFNFLNHIRQITQYTDELRKADVPPQIQASFNAKLKLLRKTWRYSSCMIVMIILTKLTIFLTYPMHSWASFLLEEITLCGGTLAVGSLFWLRDDGGRYAYTMVQ